MSIAFGILLLLAGCTKKDRVEIFDLTIVTTNKIAEPGKRYPASMAELCLPIQHEKRKREFFFANTVFIDRVREGEEVSHVKIEFNENKLSEDDLTAWKEQIRSYFDNTAVPSLFTDNNPSGFSADDALDAYLAPYKTKDYCIFYFSSDPSVTEYRDYPVYNDAGLLSKSIVQYIGQYSNYKVIIVFNPQSSNAVIANSKVEEKTVPEAKTPEAAPPVVAAPPAEAATKGKTVEPVRATPVEPKTPVKTTPTPVTTVSPKKEPPKPVKTGTKKDLKISLNEENRITWTDMGSDYYYEIVVQNYEGEGSRYTYKKSKHTLNTLNVAELNIKDPRRYSITVRAKSKSGGETKVVRASFNLIENGSRIDPRCKR